MSARTGAFNTYLLAGLLATLALALGCKNAEERKRDSIYTQLWLHLEAVPASTATNLVTAEIAGSVLRAENRPFLTEEDLLEATMIDTPEGGYAIRVQFNPHGQLVLDTVTASNRSRRIILHATYGERRKAKRAEPLPQKVVWLAAPLINRRVSDGVLVFTPNVSREEMDLLMLGLQNAAKEAAKPWVF